MNREPRRPALPTTRVDPASLVAFRVLFGLLVAGAVTRYFVKGWIHAQFEVPTYFFAYEGFGWVRPLPAPWMRVLFAIVGLGGVFVALGLFYRIAAATIAIGFTWIHLSDQTNYLNHYYLISLLAVLLTALPLHHAGSIDARLRPAIARPGFAPIVLMTLRCQVGLVYVFAGISKLGSDWLVRGEPLQTWLAAAEGIPVVGPWLAMPEVAMLASWVGAAFDLVIPFALLYPRTRVVGFVLLVVFHVATAVLFPIGMFPVFMTAFATILLPPSWPRRLRLRGVDSTAAPRPDAPRSPVLVRGAWALWFAVQVLVPMRYVALPGDVLWSEEGFRFSWRVMLIEKSAHARFEVTDPATGARFERDARGLLTPVQERMASTQPDMILALARHVGAVERARLGHPVEVRAIVDVAFNGRPSRPYVDRTIDLMRHEGSGLPANWVLPPP